MTKKEIIFNIELIVVGLVLTILSFFLCTMLGFPMPPFNGLEFAAVATSYTCTIMFAMQKRAAYFYGVISTFLLCLLFASQAIYALAIFNGILVISLIYGYWRWGPDGKPIPVTRIRDPKSIAGYLGFFGLIAAFFYLIVGGGSKVDIFLASGSATAQLMLDNKKIENWLVWIVLNVFSVFFFIKVGLWLVAIQFALFLLNAIVAYFFWNKDVKYV